MKSLIPYSILTLAFAASASAATFFSEDFSGVDFGSNLSQSGGSGIPSVTGGVVVFNGTGDNDRSWVGTNDTDYASVGFVAQVTIQIENTDETNSFTHFFGLGAGDDFDLSGGRPSFDEPVVGPTAFFGVRGVADTLVGDYNANTAAVVNSPKITGMDLGIGTFVLKLTYDNVADTLTLAVDDVEFATFIDTSDNSFDASNARIFFGSSENNTFDNFSVAAIPETSTYALLGGLIALSAVMVRRRQ